jgi:hypothetical protein
VEKEWSPETWDEDIWMITHLNYTCIIVFTL